MDGLPRPFAAPHFVTTPSPRVTRSAAKLAADTSVTAADPQVVPQTAQQTPPKPSSTSRKRKAPQPDRPSATDDQASRRYKKPKVTSPEPSASTNTTQSNRPKKAAPASEPYPAAMSAYGEGESTRRTSSSRRRQPSPPGTSTEDSSQTLIPTGTSKRRPSRKSSGQAAGRTLSSTSSGRRSKRSTHKKEIEDTSTSLKATEDEHQDPTQEDASEARKESGEDHSEDDDEMRQQDRMDEDDPFTSSLLGRMGGPSSITNALRALGGMMSGVTGRLRGILENLRRRDDPSEQLIALTELSELLLISNEDNLAGHFSPDQFVKELVVLMQPNDFGEENPEMMLLACRCIANLMEAIPSSIASVVYGGAVPVLCQKLLEIHYIDLAEQALSTLEKISVEFPASIVREGGLTACLTYLDFFATSTQRTAVTTAANCCRGIPEESFPVIRDVMPILLNVLSSNDQKVVEQGSLCVCRIVESFKWQNEKLEELVSADLLKAILRLLLPGSTNLIAANIHTQFLKVLAVSSRASPRNSVELFRLNVVDTLYQILTGISPPSGTEDVATKIDKNVIMQALIRSPKDQIFETLNVICELLPQVSVDGPVFSDDLPDSRSRAGSTPMATRSKDSPNDKRLELLAESSEEVRRFAVILFPTLMHAYTSTVNLNVRQKVLDAQLKMLSNFKTTVIQEALGSIPFASHIASILAQQEDSSLVMRTLLIAGILITRLGHIYRSQFHREGVVAEIKKLADRKLSEKQVEHKESVDDETVEPADPQSSHREAKEEAVGAIEDEKHAEAVGDQHEDGEMDDGHEDEDEDDDEDEGSDSGSSDADRASADLSEEDSFFQDLITSRSRRFMEAIAAASNGQADKEATSAVDEIRQLGKDLVTAYDEKNLSIGEELFGRLAKHFSSEGVEGITSYELLKSDIVDALLKVLSDKTPYPGIEARSTFLKVFMTSSISKLSVGTTDSPRTAFSILVHKLQDLLSRTEHFEVITVHQNPYEHSRNSATSMLAKQLRLRLSADDDSGIPKPYRNIMVSIHAIATFRALDDYLRPRISLAEQSDVRRARRALLGNSVTKSPEDTTLGQSSAQEPSTPSNSAAQSSRSHKPRRSGEDSTPDGAKTQTGSQLIRSSRESAVDTPNEAGIRPGARLNEDGANSPLECADEEKISDGDGASTPPAGMDAILDNLEDEMDEDEDGDPSAVNMELASTGKVTARKEDGTRVATPQQTAEGMSAADRLRARSLAAAREYLSSPSSTRRPTSYASALGATPQDWHIEFSINGQPISNDTTIYRAVHFNQSGSEEVSSRAVWSAMHKITFARVPGPPAEPRALSPIPEPSSTPESGLPLSLSHHPQTAGILRLMNILHSLNDNLEETVSESQADLQREPLTQFINTKLTAKLNRQLEEPLIVASNCIPSWAEDLARLYPFLFPFESRHLFLQSTSFGYSRSMARWQSGQENESRRHRDERPFLGRTQRQKVRISRTRILESALKVMELYGGSASILEVEYFEEVGTGLGPTLEFYATISKEFSKKKLKLWRENESDDTGEYAFGKNGLFPTPMSEQQADNENGKRVLHLFRLLGKFVARSMLDSRIIDISFNPTFFRIGNSTEFVPSLAAVASIDKSLAASLKVLYDVVMQKRKIGLDESLSAEEKRAACQAIRIKDSRVEDLGLDFTLPGHPEIELEPNGFKMDVNIDNVERYIERVLDMTLGSGVARQVKAFKSGFTEVFPYSALRAFTADELVMLFGQAEEDWSLETLMDSIKADHGFNLDSQSIRNLLQTMSEYSPSEQREFLQFVTGSPKLPIGGFKSLTPMFTVVCKPSEPPLTPDDYLPSVMTCVNYLKMPDYTTADVLRAKLAVAIKEGQGAFHLS